MSDPIYRFVSFPSFVDLVQRRSLSFVTYDRWDDPYEGFVLASMKTAKGASKVEECLRRMGGDIEPQGVMAILMGLRFTVHLQSWTRLIESDALWRIYGFGGWGIRIQTSREKMSRIGSVDIVDVEYKALTLEEDLRRICGGSRQIHLREVFRVKRTAFAHEQEVRVITHSDFNYIEKTQPRQGWDVPPEVARELLEQLRARGELTDADVKKVMAEILGGASQVEPSYNLKHVSLESVPDFIESVVVHPTADDWFVSMVADFCKRNELPFGGRSALYTFNHG